LWPIRATGENIPAAQAEALKGVLSEVGIAGALLAYRSERQGGALVVIDGHLRKDAAPQAWPVLILDVDDAEADYLLAVVDPLAAMAVADAGALDALLSSVQSGEAAVQQMLAELAEGAGLYAFVWHASSHNVVVARSLVDAGYDVKQMLIWNKSVAPFGRSHYSYKHEPCWYAVRRGKTANWKGPNNEVTVWDTASPRHIMGGSDEQKTPHPTQKPIMLYERPIANHTSLGDIVYEGESLFVESVIEIIRASGQVRGGSGSERNMPEYIAWRSAVYERDGYVVLRVWGNRPA
jgi:hypothetical protein